MRNPQQTQRRLIEVASKLMADLGVAGLRVDQVAAVAAATVLWTSEVV